MHGISGVLLGSQALISVLLTVSLSSSNWSAQPLASTGTGRDRALIKVIGDAIVIDIREGSATGVVNRFYGVFGRDQGY